MKRDPNDRTLAARAQMDRLGVSFSSAAEMIAYADALKPKYRFQAKTRAQWLTWRKAFLGALRQALGRPLPRVVPATRVIEKTDQGDHFRLRIIYRTTLGMWAPAYLLIPKSVAKSGRPAPAVLTIHGHGYGAVDFVGLSPEEKTGGNVHRNYALEVVRHGMVALAPDLRGFGQRAVDQDQLKRIIMERGDPEAKFFKRDMCNVQNLKATLLGHTFMGMQLHDLGVALDVLSARPEVNPGRIGCCGLSTGGMMTLFLTALDQRIKAATVSGTLTSYRSYAFRIETTCGSQLPVGMLTLGDLADVGCLIAPRPVCFEVGKADHGFLAEVARKEFRRVKACYGVAGVPGAAVLDYFDGGHEWHGVVGVPMMERWLKR